MRGTAPAGNRGAGSPASGRLRLVRPSEPTQQAGILPLGVEDPRIVAAVQAAAQQLPSIKLSPSIFAQALVDRLRQQAPSDAQSEAVLASLAVADLYLACACAHQVPAALAMLDATCLAPLSKVIAQLDPSPAFVDEALQQVRERLLCVDSQPGEDEQQQPAKLPRIASYLGVGPLRRWVRAAALRVALNLRRSERSPLHQPSDPDVLAEVAATQLDPELALLKARYRPALKAAFAQAVASLSSRERNVLRLHLIERLPAEQIGQVYGVHRVSVARWLGQLRQQLLQQTRKHLHKSLSLSAEELDELHGLFDSQLSLSISRLLRASTDGRTQPSP